MNCPKCNGETESEIQHSYFKVGEVVDVSRCLNCGFKFYEVYRKHGNWKEWHEDVREFDRYTNDMETLREKIEYKLPVYSSTSVVCPS
jgi:hypothetical protein